MGREEEALRGTVMEEEARTQSMLRLLRATVTHSGATHLSSTWTQTKKKAWPTTQKIELSSRANTGLSNVPFQLKETWEKLRVIHHSLIGVVIDETLAILSPLLLIDPIPYQQSLG